MSSRIARRVLIGLGLAAVLVPMPRGAAHAAAEPEVHAGDGAPAAQAQPERKSRRQEEEERRKFAIGHRTARIFRQVREDLDTQRYAEAQAALEKLHLDRLSPYERAQADRLFGYVAYGKQDNDAAVGYLNQALAENVLPEADQADVLFQVAQIQGAARRWSDVIATLQKWFQTVERPNSVGYFLMALSYYQLGDLDAALLPAKKAVEIASVPQQAWLQLLLAIHLTRKDYEAATPVLARMLGLYPNSGKEYWLQLSALYGVTGSNERALGIMEVAYRKGILTQDSDLRRLLQLMLLRGIPYRAAKILEKELADARLHQDAQAYELLGTSWILARELPKAEQPLARAAELSPKGDLYVRLAQIQLLQEDWNGAESTLRKALAKGGLGDPSTVQLLLGIAYYNERKLQEARSWFALAQRSTAGATRQQAATWIDHIDREIINGPATSDTAG